MIVEVYSDDTIVVEGNNQLDKLLDDGAYLLYLIEGETWNECMQKYYNKKGWGIYNPVE